MCIVGSVRVHPQVFQKEGMRIHISGVWQFVGIHKCFVQVWFSVGVHGYVVFEVHGYAQVFLNVCF